jgi:hypothetical protein
MREKIKQEAGEIRKRALTESLKLATGAFGLIAALAWNQVIQEVVNVYVKPFFGEGSGLVSLIIYAVVITILVVIVTYQVSKITEEKKD